MIFALLIGRDKSQGFPGKNIFPILNRPLMTYPVLAALNSPSVDKLYVSTDSQEIIRVAKNFNAEVIKRPDYLCTNEALGEDVFVHGYKHIKETVTNDIEFLVLLFCNAPCVLSSQIEEGIKVLRKNRDLDSVITVSKYNMYSPIRARKIGSDGLLHPFIPFELYDKEINISCDRDSQGDVFFADVCLSIVRPRCLDDLNYGILPQRWMGQKIYPLKQDGGLDIDYPWQVPLLEHWLKNNGFTDNKTPYDR